MTNLQLTQLLARFQESQVVPGVYLPLNKYRDHESGYFALEKTFNTWKACCAPGLWVELNLTLITTY
jgi:hypothetical protein